MVTVSIKRSKGGLKKWQSHQKNKANKALKLAKQNKKFLDKTIENKQVAFQRVPIFVDTGGYSSNNPGGTADPVQPSMRVGAEDGVLTTGSSSRVGNSITLMRTGIDFCFDVSTTSETYNKWRLIIVESTEGAEVLALSDILQFPLQPMSSCYTTKSLTNKRYNIMLDKKFEVNRNNNGARFLRFNKHYGKTGRVINYNGANEDPIDYKLTIIAVSDSTVAPHPQMQYTLRHSYKDA